MVQKFPNRGKICLWHLDSDSFTFLSKQVWQTDRTVQISMIAAKHGEKIESISSFVTNSIHIIIDK